MIGGLGVLGLVPESCFSIRAKPIFNVFFIFEASRCVLFFFSFSSSPSPKALLYPAYYSVQQCLALAPYSSEGQLQLSISTSPGPPSFQDDNQLLLLSPLSRP